MTNRKNKKISKDESLDIEDYQNRKSRSNNPLNELRVEIKPKTENQKKLVEVIQKNEITIASGFPGTGKTFLACAEALKLLKDSNSNYKRIILVKSVTTLKDEEIGFIKGTIEDKMEPFMDSFLDNFNKIIGEALTNKLREQGYIQIRPIAYV
jgi:phosphate starvation-inducible PhoH-like protein